jgi:hypothetical protein
MFLFGLLRTENSMFFLLAKFCFKKNKSICAFREATKCAERITLDGSPWMVHLSVSVVNFSAGFSDRKGTVFCNCNDHFYVENTQ